ncbi:MAG: hypothetical protein H0U97_00240 [Gammaproteobacteria bacterium]|nr:hypothetical protein [Gammaproteobacteria bacterium]
MKAQASDLLQSLQGQWRIVYSELDGEMTPVSEFSKIMLENKGTHFAVVKDGKVVAEGKFSIDTTTTPHQLVYIYSKGADVFLGRTPSRRRPNGGQHAQSLPRSSRPSSTNRFQYVSRL